MWVELSDKQKILNKNFNAFLQFVLRFIKITAFRKNTFREKAWLLNTRNG